MWPETAFSLTPDSNQLKFNSLQAVLIANRASKLSTQLNTKSTGPPDRLLELNLVLIIIYTKESLYFTLKYDKSG